MTTTNTQSAVIDTMREVNEKLADILRAVKQENKNGQFDYCTHPQLSELASAIESKAAIIHGIVYQTA